MAAGPPTRNATSPAATSATRATTRWPRPWVATPNMSKIRGHPPSLAARLAEGRGGHGRLCQRQDRLPRPCDDSALLQPRDLSRNHDRLQEGARSALFFLKHAQDMADGRRIAPEWIEHVLEKCSSLSGASLFPHHQVIGIAA